MFGGCFLNLVLWKFSFITLWKSEQRSLVVPVSSFTASYVQRWGLSSNRPAKV